MDIDGRGGEKADRDETTKKQETKEEEGSYNPKDSGKGRLMLGNYP
jgi:hypothetical protein